LGNEKKKDSGMILIGQPLKIIYPKLFENIIDKAITMAEVYEEGSWTLHITKHSQ
jgi:hypothetical protein